MEEHVALILIWEEAGGNFSAEEPSAHGENREHDKRNGALTDQRSGPAHVTICDAAEDSIEPVEKPSQQTSIRPLVLRFQQEGGQRRTQRQRIERRENHGEGDGNGELLIEASGNPRDER